MLKAHPAILLHFFHIAAKAHFHRLIRAHDFPQVAVFQPVVGQLHLVAVHDLLLEKAVFIADGAAHGGQFQRRQRIEKTGGQAAQAAVAQARLRLLLEQQPFIDAQPFQGLHVIFFVHQRNHVVVHGAAHEEFRRKVV